MAGTIQEGIRLFNLKRWDLALRELLQVKGDEFGTEKNTELAYYLGLCYTKLGRYDDALLYLEQVVTGISNPLRIYQCRMTLAYIYTTTSRSKMAEFELNQLVKNGFESAQIYTTLAYAAWAQKRYRQAVDLYEKALYMDENNATALNGIGFILVDTNMDILRGMQYCRKAVDRNPRNPAYLDSLGWAFFKIGQIPEARIWLRRALDMSPKEREIRNHMRIVIEEAG
jgi:tetratricopeptide (TPR) repeat protein